MMGERNGCSAIQSMAAGERWALERFLRQPEEARSEADKWRTVVRAGKDPIKERER